MQTGNSHPLKVVLLCSANHLGSAYLANGLFDNPMIDIVAVVKADAVPFTFKGARKVKKYLKKVGWRFGFMLFWQNCIQILIHAVAFFLGRDDRLLPVWKAAKKRGIPVRMVHSINAPAAVQWISNFEPDLLISAYFNQILKQQVLHIPKVTSLNVHPGWLPAYKGAMVYFWVLKKGEQDAGVTVHQMDEGIDTGKMLIREKFIIREHWTQQQVLLKTAALGLEMLEKVLAKVKDGSFSDMKIESSDDDPSYYSVPGEEDFDTYFKKRRFFRIRDIFKLIWFPFSHTRKKWKARHARSKVH